MVLISPDFTLGHDPSSPSLVKWCGDSTPSVITTGQSAFFYFQSDSIISDDEGLELEFTQGILGMLQCGVEFV